MLRQFAVIFHCSFLSPALLFVLGFSLPPFYSGETLALSPVLRACLGPLFFLLCETGSQWRCAQCRMPTESHIMPFISRFCSLYIYPSFSPSVFLEASAFVSEHPCKRVPHIHTSATDFPSSSIISIISKRFRCSFAPRRNFALNN